MIQKTFKILDVQFQECESHLSKFIQYEYLFTEKGKLDEQLK
jgi:hypothetical protein